MTEREDQGGGNGDNDKVVVKVEDLGQRPVPDWEDEAEFMKAVASADND